MGADLSNVPTLSSYSLMTWTKNLDLQTWWQKHNDLYVKRELSLSMHLSQLQPVVHPERVFWQESMLTTITRTRITGIARHPLGEKAPKRKHTRGIWNWQDTLPVGVNYAIFRIYLWDLKHRSTLTRLPFDIEGYKISLNEAKIYRWSVCEIFFLHKDRILHIADYAVDMSTSIVDRKHWNSCIEDENNLHC